MHSPPPAIAACALRFGALWLALTLAAACAARGAPEPSVSLVRDGRADCVIVVGREDAAVRAHTLSRENLTREVPAQSLGAAARDLADCLHEMTGVWDPAWRIPIVTDPAQARARHRVLLGSAAVETYGLQEEAAALPYPAYVYRAVSNDLLIFGSSTKGAANGVYGFLQDELGVRWFGPQEVFRVVPWRTNVVVGALDKTVVPSFPGRLYHMESRVEYPAYAWRRRMRMNEPIDQQEPFINSSHNLWRIFPAARYADAHPELYAMRNGRRSDPLGHLGWSICFSDTNAVAIAAAAASAHFRANPRHQSFALGINDCAAYCECGACAKLQPPRTFQGQRVASDMYFHFVNAVARKVREEFPGRYLGVIAYNDVTAPPLGPVEPNVHVVLVNDVSEYYDTAYRAKDGELVQAWQAKGITLGFYYYTGLAKLVPAYFPRLLAEELKDKHRRGFVSLSSEIYPGWPWNGPLAYLQARLWWDIELDADALLNEYFDTLFGPAAGPMRELYDLFETIHLRPRGGGFLYEHYKYQQFRPYTADDLARIRALLAAAHAAVPGLGTGYGGHEGREGQRVATVSRGLQVFLDMLDGKVLIERLETAPEALDDLQAVERLGEIGRLMALLDRHTAVYREVILADPTQSRRYTIDTCTPVRQQWRNRAADAVGAALTDLRRREEFQPSGLAGARIGQAVEAYCADPLNRAVFAVRTGQVDLGPNRVPNPGLEQVWGEGAFTNCTPAQVGIAQGWSTPGNVREAGGIIGTVAHDPPDARLGRRSGRMQKTGTSAYYFSQAFPVSTGEVYWCEADVRLNLPESRGEMKPRVFLMVRWFGKGWMHGADFVAELGTANDWTRLATAAIPPPGAQSGSVWVCAEHLWGEEEVLLDNVSARVILAKPRNHDGDVP